MQLLDNLHFKQRHSVDVDKCREMWTTILRHLSPGSKWLKVTPLVRNRHQPYIALHRVHKFESR
jgi:hypothetical protein